MDAAALSPPALECQGLHKAYGPVVAVNDVSLTVAPGELVALLGPSGCGKTTTLRLIAGFEQPDAGSIRIAGRDVVQAGTTTPPERRQVGMVFQDYALFPHLTVAGNVRYGLSPQADAGQAGLARRRRGGRVSRWLLRHWRQRPFRSMRPDVAARVAEALRLVDLSDKAGRYPHELSGGEAQRVALARALAPRPALVLLDEPFSNLDTRLRTSVRSDVRRILERAGAAAIFVTHDQEEAFALAQRVAVMLHGRIEQIDTPAAIYRHPTTRAVAEFVGEADFLPAVVEGATLQTEIGPLTLPETAAGAADAAEDRLADGATVDVMLRPEALQLEPRAPGTAETDRGGATAAACVVTDAEYYGHDQLVSVRLPSGARVRARLGPRAVFHPGDLVTVRVEGDVTVFPRAAPRRRVALAARSVPGRCTGPALRCAVQAREAAQWTWD